MRKTSFLFVLALSFLIRGVGQTSLKAFPLSSVKLLKSPFYDAQQTDLKYILELDVDRLLAPFLKEAGIAAKKRKIIPTGKIPGLMATQADITYLPCRTCMQLPEAKRRIAG